MNNIQVTKAYADWINTVKYDLFITLNTEVEFTYSELSKILSNYFYKVECDVFTEKKRKRYFKTLRIKRVVAIEHVNKRTHAHIQVKTLPNFTNEQMIELLKLCWSEHLGSNKHKDFLFNASVIANADAVSSYITKETLLANKQQSDVIDLSSSYIVCS